MAGKNGHFAVEEEKTKVFGPRVFSNINNKNQIRAMKSI